MPDFTLPLEKALAAYRYKYLALYQALRGKIRDGSLPEGTRLPASRELAAMYGLSRGSVSQAYDMLLAEGYVYARVGKGTFVAGHFAGSQGSPARLQKAGSPQINGGGPSTGFNVGDVQAEGIGKPQGWAEGADTGWGNVQRETTQKENSQRENMQRENMQRENFGGRAVPGKETQNREVQNWETQNREVQNWETQNQGTQNQETQNQGTQNQETQTWATPNRAAQGQGVEFAAPFYPAGTQTESDGKPRELRLSPWGSKLRELSERAGAAGRGRRAAEHGSGAAAPAPADALSFASGLNLPLAEFPRAAWRSALARASAEVYDGAADVFGDAGLRAAIAAHLRASRGIAADPASICCFSGSMQAIALLSQLLLGEGARAVAEDPGYPGIRLAAAAAGAAVIPAGVDGRGIVPRDWDAQVLFVTPGRQFPTGAVLAPERRRELLAWAERRNAVIVEDDFDSEFRWAGQPMEPLMAQDRGERVVFVGTFTKTLFPALRIGYAVLPPPLVEPVRLAKALFEPSSPALMEQRTLARFMARGDYDKHLRRMRRIYGARYEVFRREMDSRLGGLFEPLPLSSGLHVYARWRRSPEDYRRFRAVCAGEGISFSDVEAYWTAPHTPAACFFFAHLKPEEIAEGIRRMEAAGRKIWESWH